MHLVVDTSVLIAGATALGMAAGATLLLDRPAVLALADRHHLALVALA